MRMRAAGVPDVRSRSSSTRTVKVSVNTRNHQLGYYKSGMPRTRKNSLQLEVISNQDCYLTLASLNSKGDVYLLLPNSGQELSGFLSKGRISANTSVLIPDALADENVAGFYYDYSPPGGIDRIVGVCFTDLTDAERFRAQIAKLELGGTLDAELFKVRSRGATNITPSLAPGQPAAAPTVSETAASPGYSDAGQDRPRPAVSSPGWASAKLTLVVGSDASIDRP